MLSSLIGGRIEEREINNAQIETKDKQKSSSELKWLQNKKTQNFQYRLVVDNPENKKKHKLAVYLSEWRDVSSYSR
jgi:hypothetical protein